MQKVTGGQTARRLADAGKSSPAELLQTIREDPELMEAVAARSSPASLARYLTQTLPPDLQFQKPKHVDLISCAVREAAYQPDSRILIFAPPRHAKSHTVTKWGSTWFLEEFPYRKVMVGTYAADFGRDWGRAVRDNFEFFDGHLSTRLREDARAAGRWLTMEGGGMLTGGVGGSFTGRGANLAIIDDPFKNYQEAMSPIVRETVWNWYRSSFLTRLEPGGSIIVTLTRWHTDDIAGRILAEPDAGKWKVISLPALAMDHDPLGREPGEALWPQRYPREALEEIRIRVGAYVWDALYQQIPPNLSGLLAYYAFLRTRNVTGNAYLVEGFNLQLSVDFNRRPGMFAVLGQHFGSADLITSRKVFHAPGMTIQRLVGRVPGRSPLPPESVLHFLAAIGAIEPQREPDGRVRWTRKYPALELFGDATGRRTQESDGASNWDYVIGEFEAAGVPVIKRVPKNNPGVVDRVNATNVSFLGTDGRIRHIVHPDDCAPLVRDYENVKTDGNGGTESTDSEDESGLTHPSDANGYRIHYLMPIRTAPTTGGRIGGRRR